MCVIKYALIVPCLWMLGPYQIPIARTESNLQMVCGATAVDLCGAVLLGGGGVDACGTIVRLAEEHA